MTGFNHMLTGAVIAVTVHSVPVALGLALVSHFALDALPHFWHDRLDERGKHLKIMVTADLLLCIGAVTFCLARFPDQRPLVLACMCLAMLPDWFWVLHYVFKIQHKFFEFHQNIQRFEKPWGALVEGPFMLLIVTILWVAPR